MKKNIALILLILAITPVFIQAKESASTWLNKTWEKATDTSNKKHHKKCHHDSDCPGHNDPNNPITCTKGYCLGWAS